MDGSRRDLQVLLELTRRLTDDQPLEGALQRVTDAALALLSGHHASVRLLDESQQELMCGARSGVGADLRPVAFRPAEGIAGWVLTRGEEAWVEDASTDSRFVQKPGQGFAIGSMIAVPLWSANRVMGVLAISAPTPAAFDRDDALLMQLLANCVAPSIDRVRLNRLAITDHLTKAFNHRALSPRLTRECARALDLDHPLSLLLMDLDHFKRVNDDHSHAVGDLVLRRFADLVRAEVRVIDALIRRGGEEFVLIMPGAPGRIAIDVAERVRARLSNAPILSNDDLRLSQTVSIGVALWDRHETPEALAHRADLAMYAAKDAGRDQVMISRGDGHFEPAPPPGSSPIDD